jgi:hypothetical protein
MKFELGAPVTFTHTLDRKREYVRPLGPARQWEAPPGFDRKWWEAEPVDPWGRPGIVIGRRTLADGETHGFESTFFRPTRHFRAYIVAWHLDRAPVLCLPEHLTHKGVLDHG